MLNMNYSVRYILLFLLLVLWVGCSPKEAACSASGSPMLPVDEPYYEELPEIIRVYLSDGGDPVILESTLMGWTSLGRQHAVDVQLADLTRDGVNEVVVLAQYKIWVADGYLAEGKVFIFGCENAAYSLEYESTRLNWDNRDSRIVTIEDINATGYADIVYVWGFCSISLCSTDVQVVEWSAADSSFVELMPPEAWMQQAQITLEDHDGDGIKEIVLDTPGTVWSLAVGPRVSQTDTYIWDGTRYILGESVSGTR
jgi:hypothetical protein